jgi:hypothetical protein
VDSTSGIITVAVAAIAGGSAILGAWLTSFAAYRSTRQQWELQQIEKRRRTESDRLEELYYAIDRWYRGVRHTIETHEDVLAGRITRDNAIARLESLHAEPYMDLSRVNQLLDVYVEDLKFFVDEMLDARRVIKFYSREWIQNEADVYLLIEGEKKRIEQALAHVTGRLSKRIREAMALRQS